jgi:hypothetical protein
MIQGYVKLTDKDHRKVIVRTEYDDLVVLRVLDGTKMEVGDAVVGALDCQGENLIFDLNKRVGVQVFVENGHRLFASAGASSGSRHTLPSGRSMRRAVA